MALNAAGTSGIWACDVRDIIERVRKRRRRIANVNEFEVEIENC